MDGAKQVACSAFGDAIIASMRLGKRRAVRAPNGL
jgi:hypothetical protein